MEPPPPSSRTGHAHLGFSPNPPPPSKFCYEAANVIGKALSINALNELVTFSYLPVSHINAANGSYECEIVADDGTVYDLDCEGTNFESCLTREVCWYGDCSSDAQQQLAFFLKCYEGPGANSEDELDPSTRGPCLELAGFDAELLLAAVDVCVKGSRCL